MQLNFRNYIRQPDADAKIFECLKGKKPPIEKRPKTVGYENIEKIENMDTGCLTPRERFHIDVFLFSFYCGGLANIDTCYLTYDYIVDGFISWERHKYPKKAKMPFTDKAKAIADKYRDKCYGNYVLPVFNARQVTEKQKNKKMKTFRAELNATLKKVSAILGIEHITWYTQRGTFITKMIDEGFNAFDVTYFSGNSVMTILKNYFKRTDPQKIKNSVNSVFDTRKEKPVQIKETV